MNGPTDLRVCVNGHVISPGKDACVQDDLPAFHMLQGGVAKINIPVADQNKDSKYNSHRNVNAGT